MSNTFKPDKICVSDAYANLIPVILISMFVLYENNMAYVANSPLGKLIAILLIVYYTSIHFVYGFLACSLIILYYQYDYVKNIVINTSFEINEQFATIQSPNKTPIENLAEGISCDDASVSQFKRQYCKNGTLVNKGSVINLEMLEHIHPDIQFKNKKCNPCADTCEFSIIEEQLNAEENLKPKTSDDFSIKTMLEKINDFIPALWVKSEPFALLENMDNENRKDKKK